MAAARPMATETGAATISKTTKARISGRIMSPSPVASRSGPAP
jgi:hypothetical protein